MTKDEKARLEELTEKLSPKQKLFIEAYEVNGFNAADAIRKAGYATAHANKMGSQVLNQKIVKEVIQLRQRQTADVSTVTPEFVVRKIMKTVEKAEADNNHNATLRGLELIARHLGMFIERTEISGRDGEAIQYEKVSNDAADFARTIASLANRGREERLPRDTIN